MKDYEKKDLILKQFAEELQAGSLFNIEIEVLCKMTGFDKYRIDAILNDMQEHGFIIYKGRQADNTAYVAIKERLYEFIELGGYTAKFKLLEQEMQRLELEVEKLQKKLSINDVSNLTTIVSGVKGLVAGFFS